ncbi:hypothetical protein [Algirhabdus cladophorae]|uniref:hypothetical protein n=1 Tax=Algirhabdus cladophorae TaxID=3377108 RepID=UPI003B846D22
MAQVPATPKSQRFRNLIIAALFGPKVAERSKGLQASEAAALALRKTPAPKSEPTHVTFLIPLVGQAKVGNWHVVVAHLQDTLTSFQDQTNGNWTALICCQDQPDLPIDPRIQWLPFTPSHEGNDKWDKLTTLVEHLGQQTPEPGYVMSFDADDLLAKTAVATMLTQHAPFGYLVEQGWVKDMQDGTTALAKRQFLGKAFWKLCGSCAAFRFDQFDPTFAAFLKATLQHEHRMFPYLAKLAGRGLKRFSEPQVLYLINHGENFGARRGRVGFKTRFVQRFALKTAAQHAQIEAAFTSGPPPQPPRAP